MRFYGFGDLLGYWATQSPDRVALRGERESCSYADLQRRVLERTKDLQNSGCWMKEHPKRCFAG